MMEKEVIVGVLDTSRRIADADLAAKLRDFTISCCRFDYFGPILESDSVDRILEQAAREGYRSCVVQSYGHVMIRYRDARRGIDTNFLKALREWLAGRDCFVAGRIAEGGSIDELCFVVDLDQYRALGRPAWSELAGREEKAICELDETVLRCGYDLRPRSAADVEMFRRVRGEGIFGYDGGEGVPPDWRGFLDFVKDQATNARRGVFLGNWESYDDVERPPAGFQGPVSALYGVAAGFKPNRILETHGFGPATRVVFFDYSEVALALRQALVEEWDGADFPAFIERVAERFPDAFYQLWGNLWGSSRPGALSLEIVRKIWERELQIWGGEEAFRRHWSEYKKLPHRYLLCDLFGNPRPLLEAVQPGGSDAVMWWSNAFHSLNGVWFYDFEERRRIYRRWIEALASVAPDLLLYGKDVDNLDIGGTRIKDHLA